MPKTKNCYNGKIVHVVVDDFPYKHPNVDVSKSDQWTNEFFQRNAIARDMVNAFRILENGGVMWMDDYRGGEGQIIYHAMNAFLTKKNGEYGIIHKGYQLAIQKKTGI